MKMNLSVTALLLILALVCFLLGAVGIPSRINFVALGLFFWLLAVELGKGGMLP